MKCKVKATPLKYKGKIYKPGTIIDLEKKDAEHFIKFNFVEIIKNRSLDKAQIIIKSEETDETKRKKVLEEMFVPQLEKIAKNLNIELEVTKKAEIIGVILEAENEL